MKREHLLYGVCGACVSAMVLVLVMRSLPKPSPDQVATSSTKCLAKLDADCLWNYMSDREKRNSGLNRDQFGKMVQIIKSQIGEPTSMGQVSIEHYTQQSSADVSFSTNMNRQFRAGFVVEHGTDPHVCAVVSGLATLPFANERVNGKPIRSKGANMKMTIEFCERELEPIGLQGLPMGANYRLVSWNELREVYSKMKGWND